VSFTGSAAGWAVMLLQLLLLLQAARSANEMTWDLQQYIR